MDKSTTYTALMFGAALCTAHSALADNAETANKSNNPLNLAPGLNIQDYYTPELFGSNKHTNDSLLRGTLPVAPGDLVGVPQLLRATPAFYQPWSASGSGWSNRATVRCA